jgi:hypothetical protein
MEYKYNLVRGESNGIVVSSSIGPLVISDPFSEMLTWSYTLIRKKTKCFLIYKEIQMGWGAKSYMKKGFLICDEMCKFSPIYEQAVSHL